MSRASFLTDCNIIICLIDKPSFSKITSRHTCQVYFYKVLMAPMGGSQLSKKDRQLLALVSLKTAEFSLYLAHGSTDQVRSFSSKTIYIVWPTDCRTQRKMRSFSEKRSFSLFQDPETFASHLIIRRWVMGLSMEHPTSGYFYRYTQAPSSLCDRRE